MMRTGTPRLLAALGVAALLLGLTACQGGSDASDEPEATPTSAYPTILPSESAEPALTQDACDLLEPVDYRRYLPKGLAKYAFEVPGLAGRDGDSLSCSIRVGNYNFLSFGYAPKDEVWARILKETKPDKAPDIGVESAETLATATRTKIPAGEEGFIYTALGGLDLGAYAVSGDVAYHITPILGFSGTEAGPADLAATMVPLVMHGDEGVDLDPVQLPASCPAADDPVVTDLIGPVELARGGEFEGLPPTCDYLAGNGAALNVDPTVLVGPTFQREYDSNLLDGVEVLDPAPGVKVKLYRSPSDGSFSLFGLYPKDQIEITIGTANARSNRDFPGPGGREEFLRFTDTYLTANAPQR